MGERPAVEVSRYLGAGLTWAVATLVFLAAGAWLGERLGARAVGALVGAFVGGGAGFYWLVRQLTPGPTVRSGRPEDKKGRDG